MLPAAAAFAGRAEPWIDFVQSTVRPKLTPRFDHALPKLAEEVLIGGSLTAAAQRRA